MAIEGTHWSDMDCKLQLLCKVEHFQNLALESRISTLQNVVYICESTV